MSDYGIHDWSECRISTGVVSVMVGIHQKINRLRRPFVESIDAGLCRSSVLTIDNQNPVTVNDPPYRPALTVKDTDIAPKILKRCGQLTLTE